MIIPTKFVYMTILAIFSSFYCNFLMILFCFVFYFFLSAIFCYSVAGYYYYYFFFPSQITKTLVKKEYIHSKTLVQRHVYQFTCVQVSTRGLVYMNNSRCQFEAISTICLQLIVFPLSNFYQFVKTLTRSSPLYITTYIHKKIGNRKTCSRRAEE